MKKTLLILVALLATNMMFAIKVYINAGHGSWGSEDRNMATITHALGDTTGFYESNTNLWKALQMEAKLKQAGFTVMMSRRTNGESRALSSIKSEANNSGSDYFISIHSNAGPEGEIGGSSGKFANYPVMLFRGTNGNPYVSNSDKMAKASVLRLYEIFWTTPANKNGTGADGGPEFTSYYSPSNPDILGDYSFYGYHLGVLPTGVPGFLAEGYFHTYSPARHRALNPDWCRQEGIRYARGVKDYFGKSGESVGYIMGYVRSQTEQYTHTYYIPYKNSNDIYKPINGAKIYLYNANGDIVKTNCYKYVKRELKNQDYYTTDNNYNGVFVYDDLTPGTYTLVVKASGYKTHTQTVVVTADKTIYPEIFLTPGKDPEPVKESRLNPYAYKLSSELAADSSTIKVHFYLNGLASTVKVIFNDGEKDYVARSYTNVKAGGYSSVIAIDTMPKGKPLSWRVDITGPGLVAPLKSGKEYYFLHPTSVDVDDNPQSPNFGRLLCNEGYHSIKSKAAASLGASGATFDTYKSYTLGAGLYEFNAEFDYVTGYNGGHSFTANRLDVTSQAAVAPHRIRIADDGRIFVTSFNGGSTWSGKIMWTIKPESMNTWVPAFWYNQVASNSELQTTSGEYIAAPNVGLDVQGSGEDLKVVMLSATNECFDNKDVAYSCYEYNWGTIPAWNVAAPKKWFDGNSEHKVINHLGAQVQYDNQGGIWVCQHRASATNEYPSLVYYDKDGVCRYHEAMNNRGGGGFRFNKDFTRVIISGGNGIVGEATVYTVNKDANGYPTNLTKEFTIPMDLGTGVCDFAWDYADNVYAVSYTEEKLVAYALPYSAKRVLSTPAADQYTFTLNGTPEPSQDPEKPTETALGMNPFAYALSSALSADSTTLTVNYSLNAAAKAVNVVICSGDSVLKTVACEGIGKGTHSTDISVEGLTSDTLITWRVDVTGAESNEVRFVDNSVKMFCPTSIDIDNNPENENFGTIFCVEGRPDAKDNINYANYISYTDGAGLYVLNADGTPRRIPNQSKVRYGYNGGSGRVNQTKMYFHESSFGAFSPYRVRVSDDGRIFISSLAPNGQVLWETDPLVFSRPNAADWGSRTGWSRVMSDNNENTYMATEKRNCSHTYCGIYSLFTDDTKKFLAGPNVGFDVQGSGKDLKLLMLSGCKDAIVSATAHHFYCSEYDLGEAKTWTTVPSREIFRGHVVNYAGTQVQYDKDGNVWMCQQRNSADAETLMKFNPDGTIAYNEDPKQPHHRCGAIRFNNDFTQVAIATIGGGEGGAVTIYPVLSDGMPDWANGKEIDTKAITHYSLMDMAWDYANNLYLAADVASGTAGQCIAVYAIPHPSEKVVSTPAAAAYAFTLPKVELPTYTVSVLVNDSTMGTVEGAGIYEQGATATLTAIPYAGYEFVNWEHDGVVFSINPLNLEVNGDMTVQLTFKSTVVTGVDNVENESEKAEKLIKDGYFYIRRNNTLYTPTGARAK
ncbi:MAG: N-acetylmuramoyl-L-alanine amidase [Paludibacteraceae bacterium]|nr:N-acetylmuramoyl-L-alanine amidase [Paludibacteraceae bacterium]